MSGVRHNKKSIRRCLSNVDYNTWIKSATDENAINGFRVPGIFSIKHCCHTITFLRISNKSVTPPPVMDLSNNEEPVSQESSSHHLLKSFYVYSLPFSTVNNAMHFIWQCTKIDVNSKRMTKYIS